MTTHQTEKLSITKATTEQLLKFATTVLGISLPITATRSTILAKISAVYDGDEIEIPVEVVSSGPGLKRVNKEPTDIEDMVTIIIDKTEDNGGDQPVWVSVNGRGLWIERGKPQAVKRRYVHVLGNATRTVYEQGADVRNEIVAREVPSYPFRIIQQAA